MLYDALQTDENRAGEEARGEKWEWKTASAPHCCAGHYSTEESRAGDPNNKKRKEGGGEGGGDRRTKHLMRQSPGLATQPSSLRSVRTADSEFTPLLTHHPLWQLFCDGESPKKKNLENAAFRPGHCQNSGYMSRSECTTSLSSSRCIDDQPFPSLSPHRLRDRLWSFNSTALHRRARALSGDKQGERPKAQGKGCTVLVKLNLFSFKSGIGGGRETALHLFGRDIHSTLIDCWTRGRAKGAGRESGGLKNLTPTVVRLIHKEGNSALSSLN